MRLQFGNIVQVTSPVRLTDRSAYFQRLRERFGDGVTFLTTSPTPENPGDDFDYIATGERSYQPTAKELKLLMPDGIAWDKLGMPLYSLAINAFRGNIDKADAFFNQIIGQIRATLIENAHEKNVTV